MFKSLQELFADPNRWTRGHYAADADGKPIGINDNAACKWCLSGGCYLVYPDSNARFKVYKKLDVFIDCRILWNDAPERTHADVLELVTKAGV